MEIIEIFPLSSPRLVQSTDNRNHTVEATLSLGKTVSAMWELKKTPAISSNYPQPLSSTHLPYEGDGHLTHCVAIANVCLDDFIEWFLASL